MRRILIVTHSYSPMLNPRAFRWTALAEYWVAQGHRVDVVCGWVPPLPRTEIHNGVSVMRVGGTLSERLRKVFLMTRTHANVEAAGASANSVVVKHGNALRHIIRWLHDQTWRRLYWPDYACLWHRPAAEAAKRLLDQHRHELMISVSDPFTSHLAALSAKAHIASIRWIADIGDPLSFRNDGPPNNYALYSRRNRAAEIRVFSLADVVSVTSEGTARAYAQLQEKQRDKIRVIPPLLPSRSSAAKARPLFEVDGMYNMLYVGTLYRTFRNPTFVLSLFEGLRQASARKLRLHFVGSLNDCEDCFRPHVHQLGDSIVLHGLRNREYASHAIDSADLLVNIANSNPYQLPSKLVEYVQTGKPIVNVSRLSRDAASEFLRTYPRLLSIQEMAPTPSESQVNSLKEFMETPPNQVDHAALTRWLEQFTIERVASAYIESGPNVRAEDSCSPL